MRLNYIFVQNGNLKRVGSQRKIRTAKAMFDGLRSPGCKFVSVEPRWYLIGFESKTNLV